MIISFFFMVSALEGRDTFGLLYFPLQMDSTIVARRSLKLDTEPQPFYFTGSTFFFVLTLSSSCPEEKNKARSQENIIHLEPHVQEPNLGH